MRLAARAGGGIVGINIGANKDAPDRIADYVTGIAAFAAVASYFTVNISSRTRRACATCSRRARSRPPLGPRHGGARAPDAGAAPAVLLKIAPDLALADLDDAVAVARRRGIDGMIVSNTTITRPASLRETRVAAEAGGLSGRPLFPLATRMLAETFVRVEGAFPLVGVGGIDSGPAALAKIKAGATLVQVYSALVYRGLGLVGEIKRHLVDHLARTGAEASPPRSARTRRR